MCSGSYTRNFFWEKPQAAFSTSTRTERNGRIEALFSKELLFLKPKNKYNNQQSLFYPPNYIILRSAIMSATQLSFTLRTSANVKTAHLLGSWDNYSGQLPLSKDTLKSGGWKGTFRFSCSMLKPGQRYWYYVRFPLP